MTVGIYGFFDLRNNECLYIGQSQEIENRYKKHISALKGNRHRIPEFSQWFKVNSDFLDFRILEVCVNDNMIKNAREIFWFKECSPKFYGKQPSILEKWEHSDDTKKKISNSLLKRNNRIYPIKETSRRICVICKNKHYSIKSKLCKECGIECKECILIIQYQKPLVQLYQVEKLSIRTISMMYKDTLSRKKISNILKRVDLTPKNTGFQGRKKTLDSISQGVKTRKEKSRSKGIILDPTYNEIYQMRIIDNKSVTDIANILGCGKTTVYKILKEYNLK